MTTMILGLLRQALCQALMKLQLRRSPPARGRIELLITIILKPH